LLDTAKRAEEIAIGDGEEAARRFLEKMKPPYQQEEGSSRNR
jgi:hypothetical protein